MRDRLRRPSRALTAVLVVAAVVVVALVTVLARSGSGDGDGSGKSAAARRTTTAPAPERPVVRRSFLEQVIPARGGGGLPGAGASAQIAAAVKSMSVEDKVAQTMLLGFTGRGPTPPVLGLLRKRALGGIVVRFDNYASRDQVTSVAGRATLAARKAKHDPPFIWAPQEGGDFSALPGLPPERAPAATKDARTAGQEAQASGKALAKLDLNGVLGPSVDVGTGAEDDALGDRAFSERPGPVQAYALATLTGYKSAGVVSAAGHFPGLGAATQPVEDGPASVGLSLGQMRKRDLVPFRAAVRAEAPAIVISNASYATDDFVTPATLSRAVSTDLLRGEMGFRGVAVADDLSQPAITTTMSVADAAVQALIAGSDMVYISGPARGQEAAYAALLAAARDGKLTRERLDEAVTRILTLKREYGLVRGLRPETKPPEVAPPGTIPGPGQVPAVSPAPGAQTQPVPVQPTPVQPSTPPAAPPAP